MKGRASFGIFPGDVGHNIVLTGMRKHDVAFATGAPVAFRISVRKPEFELIPDTARYEFGPVCKEPNIADFICFKNFPNRVVQPGTDNNDFNPIVLAEPKKTLEVPVNRLTPDEPIKLVPVENTEMFRLLAETFGGRELPFLILPEQLL
jgi:hypothetical protein